jgi:predicted ATPase
MSKEDTSERNWWVITGADYSGKTTVINAIVAQGYATLNEQALEYMEDSQASGITVDDMLADQTKLQYGILGRKLAAEARQNTATTTFIDRGVHDTLGFLRYYGMPVSSEAQAAFDCANYRGVFFFDQLPLTNFRPDYAHSEGPEFLSRIGGYIFDAYVESGFDPIRVPVMGVAERTALVIDHVRQREPVPPVAALGA